MKSLYLYVMGGFLTLSLTGCTDSKNDFEDTKRNGSETVAFVPQVLSYTRAGDTQFFTGDAIGIYASVKESGQLEGAGNYVNNAKYVYNSTYFMAATDGIPVYQEEIWAMNYYAVYPYSVNQTINFTFEVGTDQSTEAKYTSNDLMMAYNAAKTSVTLVPLKFSHLMSRVVINTANSGLGSSTYTMVLLSELNKVEASLEKQSISTSRNTKAIDITMCADGTNRYKGILPPQKFVKKSVLAYIIINGKTHLAKLTEDIDLHSGSSVELDLRPVEDSNDYELSVMKNN